MFKLFATRTAFASRCVRFSSTSAAFAAAASTSARAALKSQKSAYYDYMKTSPASKREAGRAAGKEERTIDYTPTENPKAFVKDEEFRAQIRYDHGREPFGSETIGYGSREKAQAYYDGLLAMKPKPRREFSAGRGSRNGSRGGFRAGGRDSGSGAGFRSRDGFNSRDGFKPRDGFKSRSRDFKPRDSSPRDGAGRGRAPQSD